jgi:hypothetical protein
MKPFDGNRAVATPSLRIFEQPTQPPTCFHTPPVTVVVPESLP